MKKYDFDTLANRQIDNARKWDQSIVKAKFPNVRKDFIPLWIADMDFQAAPEIRTALSEMSINGAYGYTYPTERWYQSVIDWYKKRHNVVIKKEWITLGYGTVPNMHILVQSFLDANDSILLNTPIYGPFAYAAEHNNRQVITVPLLKHNNRYEIDWVNVERNMKEKHPKATFFCSPHNPSGRIWSKSEIIKMAELCQKYHVLFVSDEVHSEHIIEGTFTSSLEMDSEYMDNLVMFTSPNKAFNLGGLKLSYSIIPNETIRNQFRKQYTKNSVTSPNVPGQIAMTTAYEECDEWLDQCATYIKDNLEITKTYIDKYFEGWKMMEMDSSYLPWIDVSKAKLDMHEIAKIMAEDAGVVVGIGDDYVSDADDFLRLNLGTSHAVIEEAMSRMAKTWQKVIANEMENV
ncbi:MalY/PatB family protein [Companilactobacillus nantensis]|uniref:cysteine-S-conjugate beta-lyase n=1 Tax=Companilactobacillus nantensis DSM 16982 TaxID=1423774 RepID=A0A0R1WDB7_9LACO|nr:aminotransferase class I/II-fold pyridoxal phosphate-dependent enzyme [Companilactobacillus nantensis]KRM15775.1 aminotransferase [Companilactobacillus nantensis DSM 16982]GEO64557.1 aminotransferase [Companilactobacillus nantensis]